MIDESTMGIPPSSDERRLQLRKSASGAASGQAVRGFSHGFRVRPAWEFCQAEPVPVTLSAERNSRASV